MLRRQHTLHALHLLSQLLHRTLVARHVLVVLLLEDLHHVLHHHLIKVLASQMRVSVRGKHLEHTVIDRQHRHIEGTATQIEHQNVLLAVLLVQTVRNSGSRRLVDDTLHSQSSNRSGILRSLTLCIIEVRRHRNHSVLHLLTQIRLGNLLHLRQHHGRNLLGRELLLAVVRQHLDRGLALAVHQVERPHLLVLLHRRIVVLATNHTLHVENRSLRIDRSLVLGSVSNHTLLVIPSNIRRRNTISLLVRNNLHLTLSVHTHTRVGRSKINSNHISKTLLFAHR